MEDKIKVYAMLAAHSYPKRRMEEKNIKRLKMFNSKTRKIDLNSLYLNKYKKISDLCPTNFCTYENKSDKEIVMAIRGTDKTFIEEGDLITDMFLFKGDETKRNIYKRVYNNLKIIIKRYPNYKITLTAHSLGARLAINLLDSNLGDKIDYVYAFNPGTSIPQLYKSNECYIENQSKKKKEICDRRDKKLSIHIVNRDIISVLSIGERAKTHKIHKRKLMSSRLLGKSKTIKSNHAILNFI